MYVKKLRRQPGGLIDARAFDSPAAVAQYEIVRAIRKRLKQAGYKRKK